MKEIASFIDENGRLTAMPAKFRKKLIALYYLGSKLYERLGTGKYTESEINDFIDELTLFHDPATLRRELYNKHILGRESDGSAYWKETLPSYEEFMGKNL